MHTSLWADWFRDGMFFFSLRQQILQNTQAHLPHICATVALCAQ